MSAESENRINSVGRSNRALRSELLAAGIHGGLLLAVSGLVWVWAGPLLSLSAFFVALGVSLTLVDPVGERPATGRDAAAASARAIRDGQCEGPPTPHIEIYTTGWCGYCRRALALLDRKGVSYQQINVTGDREGRREMTRRAGRSSVPQIFIDGAHVGGSSDLEAMAVSGALDQLLDRVSCKGDDGALRRLQGRPVEQISSKHPD